jgi:hypothetical protein
MPYQDQTMDMYACTYMYLPFQRGALVEGAGAPKPPPPVKLTVTGAAYPVPDLTGGKAASPGIGGWARWLEDDVRRPSYRVLVLMALPDDGNRDCTGPEFSSSPTALSRREGEYSC